VARNGCCLVNFEVARLCIYKNLIVQLCLKRWELKYYRKKNKLSKDIEIVPTRSELLHIVAHVCVLEGPCIFSSRIMVGTS